jgi:hypothetical protein
VAGVNQYRRIMKGTPSQIGERGILATDWTRGSNYRIAYNRNIAHCRGHSKQ